MGRKKGQRNIPPTQHPFRRFRAVHAGSQIDVHEDQVRRKGFYDAEGFLACGGQKNLVAVLFQNALFGHGDEQFVLHQQDGLGRERCGGDMVGGVFHGRFLLASVFAAALSPGAGKFFSHRGSMTRKGFFFQMEKRAQGNLGLLFREDKRPLTKTPAPLYSSLRAGTGALPNGVGWPSGQRQQTVNLPTDVYEGSNPSPTTIKMRRLSSAGRAHPW